MSTFTDVIAQAGRGATPEEVARQCGISRDLVGVMVDEAERLGVLTIIRTRNCAEACEPVAACAGCPLAPRR